MQVCLYDIEHVYGTCLNEKRAVVIAVHSDAVPALEITTERLYQCRMSATKITDDILKWIKMTSGIERCIYCKKEIMKQNLTLILHYD